MAVSIVLDEKTDIQVGIRGITSVRVPAVSKIVYRLDGGISLQHHNGEWRKFSKYVGPTVRTADGGLAFGHYA